MKIMLHFVKSIKEGLNKITLVDVNKSQSRLFLRELLKTYDSILFIFFVNTFLNLV